MNHLAHCFLSFNDASLLIGNFIGDYVKGNDWKQYPVPIQQGILLHRAIDMFTDEHPMVAKSVARLRPFGGRYTPPVVDVLYDHILCRYWDRYATSSLGYFGEQTYQQLQQQAMYMPPVLQERFPRMLEARFLDAYATEPGMRFVLDRFSRRLPANFDPEATLAYFWENITAFSEDFNAFFPELLAHARAFLSVPKT